MGLLDKFFGNADQTQALGLLGMGMMNGGFGHGAGLAMNHLAEAPMRQKKMSLLDMQIAETQAQAAQRQADAERERAALERQRAIQQALPGLFGQGGPAGMPGAPGGMPGQQQGGAPGGLSGFNIQEAIRLGMDPKQIQEYAGLQNIGRPKATRQMEVDDGKGGKRIALVDDYGREVAGFAGYTPPVQVNQGDKVSFVRPEAGVSLPMGMSPDSRASNALGWANNALTRRGQDLADARARETASAGRVPPGYRFTPAGTLEAIPGGPADIKAGELGAKAEARQESAVAQADSVLKEIKEAKDLVSWKTAGVGGVMSVLPATEARDLSAKLQTVKANLGFDRLQQMRDQSPTGGALGQVAVQELASLQATVASLDQMQSPKQLGEALDKIEKHYEKWRDVVKQSKTPQGGASGGWGIQKVQ